MRKTVRFAVVLLGAIFGLLSLQAPAFGLDGSASNPANQCAKVCGHFVSTAEHFFIVTSEGHEISVELQEPSTQAIEELNQTVLNAGNAQKELCVLLSGLSESPQSSAVIGIEWKDPKKSGVSVSSQ